MEEGKTITNRARMSFSWLVSPALKITNPFARDVPKSNEDKEDKTTAVETPRPIEQAAPLSATERMDILKASEIFDVEIEFDEDKILM